MTREIERMDERMYLDEVREKDLISTIDTLRDAIRVKNEQLLAVCSELGTIQAKEEMVQAIRSMRQSRARLVWAFRKAQNDARIWDITSLVEIVNQRNALRDRVAELEKQLNVTRDVFKRVNRVKRELKRELDDANKWAKQYHDDWVMVRDERDAANARAAQLDDEFYNFRHNATERFDLDIFDEPCLKCGGARIISYSNTTGWRGGFGGQAISNDVCNECWGSGQRNRKFRNLKDDYEYSKLLEKELAAANERAAQAEADARALAEYANDTSTTPPITIMKKYIGGAK